LGGDSILLSQLYEFIEEEFPGKVTLMELFEYTSIYKLSKYLSGSSEEETLEDTETIDKEIIANEMDRLVRELEEGNLTIDEILLDIDEM